MSRMTKFIVLGLIGAGLLVWVISCAADYNRDPNRPYHSGGYWRRPGGFFFFWPRSYYHGGGSSAPAPTHGHSAPSSRGGFGSTGGAHSIGA